MAKQVLCSSGKIVGLEYRLFMSKTIDVDDLKANMVWVKLPPSNKRSISEQWRRLSKQPWFAGLMAGDKDDRLGVRVWGGAVLPETREEIAGLLGIQLTPPVTRVRVRGYGISMGLVSGSQSAAQREADRVFGANTVKVQRCQHLKHSGLINPVFDMDLTGVPPDGRAALHRRRIRGCLSVGGTYVCVNPLAPHTPRWGKTRRSLRSRGVSCLMMKKRRTRLQEPPRQRRMRAFSEPPSPPWKMALSYRSSEIRSDKRYLFARPSRGRIQFSGRCDWNGRNPAH